MHDRYVKFRDEAQNIHTVFPSLRYIEEGGMPTVVGEITLEDADNNLIDRYKVKIVPSPDYPSRLPLAYETGGRIPNNIDWHVYPQGHCCVMSQPAEILLCKQKITLAVYIKEHLIPYFFNQKHRELQGYFLRECAHGAIGNIDFFKEILHASDYSEVVKALTFMLTNKGPSRTDFCFCGSGKKYRKCHREAYRRLREFSNEELSHFCNMAKTVNQTARQ